MEELIANRYVNALVDVVSAEQRAEFSKILTKKKTIKKKYKKQKT